MPKDKSPNLDGLDLEGQDLTPIKPQEPDEIDRQIAKVLDKPPELIAKRLPKHLQRRSLKMEEDMWMKILSKDENSLFIEYATEQTAKAKRTRFYMARSYLAATMNDDWPNLVEDLNRYSIALITNTQLGKTYLHFIRLPLVDNLLTELPS